MRRCGLRPIRGESLSVFARYDAIKGVHLQVPLHNNGLDRVATGVGGVARAGHPARKDRWWTLLSTGCKRLGFGRRPGGRAGTAIRAVTAWRPRSSLPEPWRSATPVTLMDLRLSSRAPSGRRFCSARETAISTVLTCTQLDGQVNSRCTGEFPHFNAGSASVVAEWP